MHHRWGTDAMEPYSHCGLGTMRMEPTDYRRGTDAMEPYSHCRTGTHCMWGTNAMEPYSQHRLEPYSKWFIQLNSINAQGYNAGES